MRLKYLSEKELSKLNSEIDSERDRLIFNILYETGCYINELVNIKVRDVNIKRKVISFKGKESKISTELNKKLKSFTKLKKEYLFSTNQSDKITSKRVRQLIHKYTANILGEKLNPKSIRYGHIADSLGKKSLVEIQRQTGMGNLRLRQLGRQIPSSERKIAIPSSGLIAIIIAALILPFLLANVYLTGFSVNEASYPPSSALVCDIDGCPVDATHLVSYDDNKKADIKLNPSVDFPPVAYMNLSWNNSFPSGISISSVIFIIEHKVSDHEIILLRIWNMENSSWTDITTIPKLIDHELETVDLTNYINTESEAENILLQYYFNGFGHATVDWVSLSFNYTVIENYPPSKVILLSPLSGNITLSRMPTFFWNESTDYENDSLTYQIMISNSTNFSYLLVDASVNNTNYTSSELPTDIVLYWKVRAYDGYSYGEWSDVRNFTVQSSLIVSLPVNTVDFGYLKPGEGNDTEDNSPYPLIVQNDGNILSDIIIKASDLWIRKPNPSSYYQYKIGVNESNSFNSFLSTLNWTFMPTSNSIVDIADLKYTDESDSARIDLNITAAGDEPSGTRNSTITITAEAAE